MKLKVFSKNKKAFSLIELSVVLIIVSILMVGGVGLGITVTKSTNKKDVQARLDVIEKGLSNFILQNGRLPCPASLNDKPTVASYGKEIGAPGDCSGTGVYRNSAINNNKLVYGAIPFSSLGLNPSYGRDPWGYKISYIVDRRLTIANDDATNEYDFKSVPAKKYDGVTTSRRNLLITIKSGDNNQIITEEAVYVLVSHGENGQGAFIDETGVQFNDSTNFTSEELSNIYSSATKFDNIFISNKSDGVFDDGVRFKSKLQLLKDSGIKYMACADTDSLFYISGDEIFLLDPDSSTINLTAEYGEEVQYTDSSTGNCYRKFCEGYGMWSFEASDCTEITGGSCFGS